ncbi:hypothetical protein CHUAL_009677, partial [Chamberlinius hualienensis]
NDNHIPRYRKGNEDLSWSKMDHSKQLHFRKATIQKLADSNCIYGIKFYPTRFTMIH